MSRQHAQVTIPNTEVRSLSSSIVDQEYQIFVAFPHGYDTSDMAYPVLYLLDANGFFGLVTETVSMLQVFQELPEMLIVGIGYPAEGFIQTSGIRVRDLTPTEDRAWLEAMLRLRPGLAADGSGGAHNFLRFIQEELLPFVHANYRVEPNDSVIAGYSFGGLFSLYALLHAPGTFRRYLIGSPSIWWDPKTVFEYEAQYARDHSDLPARVFLSAGSLEESMPQPFRGQPAAFVSNMLSLATRLQGRGYQGLDLKTHVFEGEIHASGAPAAMSRGLREVFG